MKLGAILVATLGLLALMSATTSVKASTWFTQPSNDSGSLGILGGGTTFDLSANGVFDGTQSGVLTVYGDESNGKASFVNATFTSGNTTTDLLTNATGTFSSTGSAFTSSFTYDGKVYDLSGTENNTTSYPMFGATLSNVTGTVGTVAPAPEASTVLSFGAMLALAALFAVPGKRRQSNLVA